MRAHCAELPVSARAPVERPPLGDLVSAGVRVHNVYSIDPDNCYNGLVYWDKEFLAWKKHIIELLQQTSVNVMHVDPNEAKSASLVWTPDVPGNNTHLFVRAFGCAASYAMLKTVLGKQHIPVRTLTLDLTILEDDDLETQLTANIAAIKQIIEGNKEFLRSVFVYVRGNVSDYEQTQLPVLLPLFLALSQEFHPQPDGKRVFVVVNGDTLSDYSWEQLVYSWSVLRRDLFGGFSVVEDSELDICTVV